MYSATSKEAHMLNDAQQQHVNTMQQVAALLAQAHTLLAATDSNTARAALRQLDEARMSVGGACSELYYDNTADEYDTDY